MASSENHEHSSPSSRGKRKILVVVVVVVIFIIFASGENNQLRRIFRIRAVARTLIGISELFYSCYYERRSGGRNIGSILDGT